jgi:hypothetical protein
MSVNIQVTAQTQQAAQAMTQFAAQTSQAISAVAANSTQGARQLDVFAKTAQAAFVNTAQVSRRLQQQSALTTAEMARSAGALRSAATSLTFTAAMFAGPGVQQAVLPVMLLGQQTNAVAQAMKLVGVSAPFAVAGVAAITAAVVTGTVAVQAYLAKWNEVQAEQARMTQESSLSGRFTDIILRGQAAGKISDSQADTLFDKLASTDPRKIREVAQALREFVLPADRTEAATKLFQAQEEMRINALTGLEKERAEAERAKTQRLQAINEELAVFKSFNELKSAYIDAGRAREIEGLTSIEQVRSRLYVTADAEFQTRMTRLAEAEDKERLARSAATEAEIVKRLQAEERALQEEIKLIERYQREQEQADAEFLRRMEERRQRNLQRVANDPFLTDAEKFRSMQAMGAGTDELGADPNSFGEQFRSQLVQLQNEIGTFSQAGAAMINNGLRSALDGVSQSIYGVITGARNMGQIWISVLGQMAQMAIRFGVEQLFAFLTVQGKQLIAHITTERAKTVSTVRESTARKAAVLGEAAAEGVATGAKAAGSVASIPYVGWALAIAAFASVVAMIASATDGARATGGPVWRDGTFVVGERGPELFVPQSDGQILNNSDTMKVLSGAGGASGGAGQSNQSIKVVMVGDINKAIEEALNSEFGERVIVQTMNGKRLDLGFPT